MFMSKSGRTSGVALRLLASVVAAVFVAGCSPADGEENAAPEFRHLVDTVVLRVQEDYLAQRRFAGRIEALQSASIGVELEGKVAAIHVKEGDQVSAGDRLLSLDLRLVDSALNQAGAEAQAIEADVDKLRKDMKRERELRGKGYVSQGRIDQLEAALKGQRARLAAARARIDSLKLQREKSVLRADFDAEVFRIHAEVGEVVAPERVLLELASLNEREALFGIPESLASGLSVGDAVPLHGRFGHAEGHVHSIRRALDTRTLTWQLKVSLPDEVEATSGDLVHVGLDERRPARGAWLPLESLVADVRGTWAVYAVELHEGGAYSIHKRAVRPLYQERGRVFVESSIPDGTRIVSSGVHRVAPGLRVRLADTRLTER